MLTETFCHLPGIGCETEAELWRRGIRTWDDFDAATPRDCGLGQGRYDELAAGVDDSRSALADQWHQKFAERLGAKHAWRAWPDFHDQVLYLDIETEGDQNPDGVTMIGLYDGFEFTCLVKGDDLESFREIISTCSLLVTFFGRSFDVPMLKKRFPDIVFDQIHFDLCQGFKQVGVRGGLKKIEKRFGMDRGDTDGLTGWDAVKLWRRHMRGDRSALPTLIDYNREDVVNMHPLAKICWNMLREQTLRQADICDR